MPPVVINLRKADDSRDVVHRAVQTLSEGKLVVFPTETVYGLGACARSAEAVERIFDVKGRDDAAPLALAIRGAEDAIDYAPGLNRRAERLARRCWPGPVTLVTPHGPRSLVERLPEAVRKRVAPQGEIGLRVPAHWLVLDVLQMLAGPIALTSANRSGQPPAATGEEAVKALGDAVGLVLDDGPCHYGQASTVVRATDGGIECLREGVVARDTLDRLASMLIVVVCTGNTCRSPMAEAMLRRMIAERLGCTSGELDARGVVVASAGIAASAGGPAATEAIDVMRSKGLDISCHQSQPLTEKLAQHADLLLTLTAAHRHAILRRWPDAATRTHTLRPDGGDIADPIGGPVEVYQQCAAQIEQALRDRVASMTFE